MKKGRIILWVIIGICILGLLAGLVFTLIQDENNKAFTKAMEGFDPAKATGSLIAVYNTDEEAYISSYVSKDLLAKKPEDVGYILNVHYSNTGASYSGGHYVTGKIVHAQLVDCDTGEILGENEFHPYFPQTISSDTKSVSVDSSAVIKWVNRHYPEFPDDMENHVWEEATCTEPKICTDCGRVGGEPLGHSWGEATCEEDQVCSRCGEVGSAATGHKLSWVIDSDDASRMTGTCSVCGDTFVEDTDWETMSASFITGKWRVDSYDPEAKGEIEEIYLTVNADGTAYVDRGSKQTAFEWSFAGEDFDPRYSDEYTVEYYFRPEGAKKNTTARFDNDGYSGISFFELKVDGETFRFEKTLDTESLQHDVQEWALVKEDVKYMSGVCSECGETVVTDTDWFKFIYNLPTATWKLRDILKDDRFTSETGSTPTVKFTINADHTAIMETPEGDYSFEWYCRNVSLSENYPYMFTIYYDVFDENGNKYRMGYNDGNSLAFYADEESLFFRFYFK